MYTLELSLPFSKVAMYWYPETVDDFYEINVLIVGLDKENMSKSQKQETLTFCCQQGNKWIDTKCRKFYKKLLTTIVILSLWPVFQCPVLAISFILYTFVVLQCVTVSLIDNIKAKLLKVKKNNACFEMFCYYLKVENVILNKYSAGLFKTCVSKTFPFSQTDITNALV